MRRLAGVVTVLLAAIVPACAPGAPSTGSVPAPPLPDRPWPMHTIAGQFRGANGLGVGDVDDDGDVDYLTNYEFDQRYVLSINPGVGSAAQRRQWQQVQVWPPGGGAPAAGRGVNPENSVLGDVDGDGHLDVIAAQGESLLEFWEGSSPGIRVIFGPGGPDALDPARWVDAGRVPATTTFGHFHWVSVRDVNGDGVDDVVAGGRESATTGDLAGIVWLEAPADPAQRRDLSRWALHSIDPTQFSGHGFVYDDVDMDGDVDLVDANADFDTPAAEESVHWYENPGAGSPALRSPWQRHEIYRGPEFHTKPRIGVGDLDGDGLTDYVTAVESEVLVFLKTSIDPVAFELVRVPKHPAAEFLTRPVTVVDVDGDGRLDVVGMMTHEGSVLPQRKAAVFWMEFSGDRPTPSNWTTHVIRWGSGKTALIPEFGEKWDNVDLRDVDGDGDVDLVANDEEWWMQQPLEVLPYPDAGVDPSTVAVVWFENVVGEPSPIVPQEGDRVTIEAERPDRVDDGQWTARSAYPGAEGDGYLQVHNAVGPLFDETLPGSERLLGHLAAGRFGTVRYTVDVTGGAYRLWVRRWAPRDWGYALGSGASDSAWLRVDGRPPVVLDDIGGPFDAWVWHEHSEALVLDPGVHHFTLQARDRGYAIDRMELRAVGEP